MDNASPRREVRAKLVDKSVAKPVGPSAIVGLARRGSGPKAVSRMQISGVDYGLAVPSGVSLCPAGSSVRMHRAMITTPDLHSSRDPAPPTARSIRSSATRPQYVHEGLSRRARRARSSSRSRRSTRSARSRAAGPGSPSPRWQGRGGSAPIGAIVVASAGNFGQGVAYAARALGVPAVVFTSQCQPGQGRSGCAPSAPTVIAVGEDFDAARAASEAYAAENPRRAARRRRRRRGSRPVRRRWRSS